MKSFSTLIAAVLASASLVCAESQETEGYTPPSSSSSLRCVPTVTVTALKGPDEGCNVQCQTGCIADAALVLPCGCTTAESTVTDTVKICPTPPCVSCTTGFGIVTTDDCPTTSATATPY
ncbi:hypothetical protein CDD82_7544 [Ophiocordyceps australis]|uniref:Extracellular membrane protein CFEM domain-containing protein n=1 Tax=Ophiocordyceps australis TaxID=1399860 RepID=A0A2C5YQ55_9HYPO|nr:hypothetical protein CDD82_7544 [Ophiocordyceps australis]